MLHKGVLLFMAWLLCCVWAQYGVVGFEHHRRSLLETARHWVSGTQERCITFQSACDNYLINVALAYEIKKGEFRTRGWMILAPGQTTKVNSPIGAGGYGSCLGLLLAI